MYRSHDHCTHTRSNSDCGRANPSNTRSKRRSALHLSEYKRAWWEGGDAVQAVIVSLLDRFRFGMLDRRLISVNGKPVKPYLLQSDVWVVSFNALAWFESPTTRRLSHFAPTKEQDGGQDWQVARNYPNPEAVGMAF